MRPLILATLALATLATVHASSGARGPDQQPPEQVVTHQSEQPIQKMTIQAIEGQLPVLIVSERQELAIFVAQEHRPQPYRGGTVLKSSLYRGALFSHRSYLARPPSGKVDTSG